MLAESHTVVAADLRGYGDSSKPLGGGDHSMTAFGRWRPTSSRRFARWAMSASRWWGMIAGARVAHRMARDHPRAVERVAFLDIVPTEYVYAHVDRSAAAAFWHWFFLTLPEPIPERMIEPAAIFFLHFMLGSLGSGLDVYAPEALAEYERCFADPAAIRGMCEDYRAAGSIDLAHDADDRDRLIRCPVLLLWGARGVVGALYDPIEVWRGYAADVRGQALDAGHYLAEERPLETLAAPGRKPLQPPRPASRVRLTERLTRRQPPCWRCSPPE